MRLRLPPPLADGMMRCPAVPVALTMMLGIALAKFVLPAWPGTWLSIAMATLTCAIACHARAVISTLCLLLTALFGTIAATDVAMHRYPADDVGLYAGDDARLCRLRLYLPNEPRLRTVGFAGRLPFPPSQTTLAEVRAVLTRSGWTPGSGRVLLQVHQVNDQLAAGQTIEAVALLERPGVAMNPGQFDWQRYYREQGILCSVHVRRAENITILDRSPAPLLTRWREGVRAALGRGFSEAQSLDQALVTALVLGDYDPELRDVKDDFRRTGTSHHLAISGMHIAVVGGLVFLLCRLVGLGPRKCWIASLVVIGLYGCAAMPSPPVLRAIILFGVAGGAFLCGRFSSSVQLLMLTVAIMLAIHPLDLFNAGFQLSFGTVLGLLLLSEPLAARWAGPEHVLLPDEVAQLPAPARLIRWIDKWHLQVWSTGLIAWLVSMPLIASHFSRLNPWQVPASIVLAPLVTLSLLGGVAKIVGTALLPAAGSMLAGLAVAPSAWMRGVVDVLARAPYADVPLAAPPAWLVALCWVSLALAITRWPIASLRLGAIALVGGTFLYMLVGPYWFGSSSTLPSGHTRVTLMAVGAGQCALVESGGRVDLIDCGSASVRDLTQNVVVPLLREYGITHVDSIFVSHANIDHYNSVAHVAQAYGAHEVLVADTFEATARQTPTGRAFLKQLSTIELPPRVVRPGDRIPVGKDATLDVLWPAAGGGALDPNDASMVVRLTKAGRSVLFTGDIQADGMRGLLAGADAPRADVLVAPHHGSSEDVTPAFLRAVGPMWVVSSNDRTLTGKQRRFDAMMNGQTVWRTNECGAITILIDENGTMRVDRFVK